MSLRDPETLTTMEDVWAELCKIQTWNMKFMTPEELRELSTWLVSAADRLAELAYGKEAQ